VAWVRGAAHRLDGIDLDTDDRDLGSLADLVGPARIVGLGESWHCVQEFLAIRYRLVRYLVERLGFTVVLFEGSLSTSRVLDEYINGANAELVLSVLWDNAATRRFLAWLREHNNGAEQPVRALGLDTHILIMDDVHRPGAAFESVVEFLRSVDPEYALPHLEAVRRVFADFPRATSRPTSPTSSASIPTTVPGCARRSPRRWRGYDGIVRRTRTAPPARTSTGRCSAPRCCFRRWMSTRLR
jgi:erythromycin esterase